MENQATQPIQTIGTHPHSRKTIGMQTGSTPKTVRSWIAKAGVTGAQIQNVERFTDEQLDLILSFRAKPKTEEIEAELIEPGAITLHQGNAIEARPIINFDLPAIALSTQTIDTTALDAQTAQYQAQAQNGANAIAAALSARLDMGIAQIVAEQNNLLAGIKAAALNGVAQSVNQGQKS